MVEDRLPHLTPNEIVSLYIAGDFNKEDKVLV